MTDVPAARQFLYANARLLERHRAAVLFDGAAAEPVVQALRAYRNADGGFGHGLEPDVRTPRSETTAALHALEVLAEVGALGDPVAAGMVADVVAWLASVSDEDGGIPFALPGVTDFPHGPWMSAEPGGSHLTFGLAAVLTGTGLLTAATDWCWRRLESPEPLGAYWVKFALDFLDASPDDARARVALDRVRPTLRPDGSVPVPGGTADERLTPLTLSPHPGARSRSLFTDDQLAVDLDALAAGQRDDGGWTVDYLPWSPAQAVEWRGIATLQALATLRAHGR